MAFIRKKKVNGREYYYLVENYRQSGKVRQKTLAYLGPCSSVEGAIADLEARAERYRGYSETARHRAENPDGWRQHKHRRAHLERAEKLEREASDFESRARNLRQFVSDGEAS